MKKKKNKDKLKKIKLKKKEFYKNKQNILKDSILNFSKNIQLIKVNSENLFIF